MPIAVVNGLRISYNDTGSGAPLLLLPGTCENKEYWHEYQVPFLCQYFRVLTIDQRGIGESDRVVEQFETRDLAHDAIELLDAVGVTEPTHVLGHSMGGRTAQWIALDHPERVRSLILVSSGSGQYDDTKPVERSVPLWQVAKMIEMGFEPYVKDNMTGRLGFTTGFRAAHPEVPEKLFKSWQAGNPTIMSWLLHSAARQRHETTALLGQIQCPVLAICGAEDTVLGGTSHHPTSTKILAERTKNGSLVMVEGAAHHLFWEVPDRVNMIVTEFVSTN